MYYNVYIHKWYLQVLKAETKEIDSQWEDLTETKAILIGGISPDSAQVLSEHLEEEKARLDFTHTSKAMQMCM